MSEIAMDSGFGSLSTFSRTFKKHYGISPELGGKKIVGPIKIPIGQFGWFTDIDGNVIRSRQSAAEGRLILQSNVPIRWSHKVSTQFILILSFNSETQYMLESPQ